MLPENKNATIYGGAAERAVAKEFARMYAMVFVSGRAREKLEARDRTRVRRGPGEESEGRIE